MAIYSVFGADKQTGAEESILIEAGDENHAKERARDKGILVSSAALYKESLTEERLRSIDQSLRLIRGWVTFWGIISVIACIYVLLRAWKQGF